MVTKMGIFNKTPKSYEMKKECTNCRRETIIYIPFGVSVNDFISSGQATCQSCGCSIMKVVRKLPPMPKSDPKPQARQKPKPPKKKLKRKPKREEVVEEEDEEEIEDEDYEEEDTLTSNAPEVVPW